MTPALVFSKSVERAKSEGRAIVALESTIITHGMPYPDNVETARLVEEVVRNEGAEPATIAVLAGVIHIGLEPEQLEMLGQAKDVRKLSRADFALALAQGADGATTVSATMIAAHLAGIEVFATGGIGGVHKGAEDSFDISADLLELAQTPVSVVCAGPKAILDLPKTLEVLETHGVPVITFAQDALPAFWSRDSGLLSPLRADTIKELATGHKTRKRLGLPGGQLINNPIPAEFEIPREIIGPIVDSAIAEADTQGIQAKDVTPFLLQRIFELSDGKSLRANIELVKNNAKLASQIAIELNDISIGNDN